jgi:hypothetical protein
VPLLAPGKTWPEVESVWLVFLLVDMSAAKWVLLALGMRDRLTVSLSVELEA